MIRQIRSFGYPFLKYLGDIQAVEQAAKTGSAKPLERRVERRLLGKAAGRAIGRIVR